MLRIPLAPGRPKTSPTATVAPYLEGLLLFEGKDVPSQLFLVDTGADATLIRHGPGDRFKQIFQKGKQDHCQGVGGIWPARTFKGGWELVVMADDTDLQKQEPLTLLLPHLSIMAPFAKLTDKKHYEAPGDLGLFVYEEVDHAPSVPPGTRPEIARRRLEPYCRAPHIENLLGRDVFEKNGLRLEWGPDRQSHFAITAPRQEVNQKPSPLESRRE